MSEPLPRPVAPDQRPLPESPWRHRGRLMLRRAVDLGLVGRRLDTHVVICGFPRSGSTLLQLMIGATVADLYHDTTEVRALWAAREAPRRERWMVTKCPADIEQVPDLRAWYRHRPGAVHFLLTERDPRSVLTSRHAGYPPSEGYYVSTARWLAVHRLVRAVQQDPDVLVVRYERLVTDPDEVQQQLAARIGWTTQGSFADHPVPLAGTSLDRMTGAALGGVRPVEQAPVAAWRAAEHRPRLRQVLEDLPWLPRHLVERGFDTDERWVEAL